MSIKILDSGTLPHTLTKWQKYSLFAITRLLLWNVQLDYFLQPEDEPIKMKKSRISIYGILTEPEMIHVAYLNAYFAAFNAAY